MKKIINSIFFILLLVVLIQMVLANNNIFESFDKLNYKDYFNKVYNNPKYRHTVDLPLTTVYSCNNMCSSQSKCYLTGEQCMSDTDCFGCKIPVPKNIFFDNNVVKGNNNAGKYSYLVPQYSSLTSDIGTQSKLYNKNKLTPVPNAYIKPLYGKSANLAGKINKDNSSYIWDPLLNDYKYLPKYPTRHSSTGLFMDDGPLASNAFL